MENTKNDIQKTLQDAIPADIKPAIEPEMVTMPVDEINKRLNEAYREGQISGSITTLIKVRNDINNYLNDLIVDTEVNKHS
jgi:hypothetical protein